MSGRLEARGRLRCALDPPSRRALRALLRMRWEGGRSGECNARRTHPNTSAVMGSGLALRAIRNDSEGVAARPAPLSRTSEAKIRDPGGVREAPGSRICAALRSACPGKGRGSEKGGEGPGPAGDVRESAASSGRDAFLQHEQPPGGSRRRRTRLAGPLEEPSSRAGAGPPAEPRLWPEGRTPER